MGLAFINNLDLVQNVWAHDPEIHSHLEQALDDKPVTDKNKLFYMLPTGKYEHIFPYKVKTLPSNAESQSKVGGSQSDRNQSPS